MSMRNYIDAVNGASIKLDEKQLFRGDSSMIDEFSFDKSDSMALYKQGIYLTDSPEIAKDYTLKGGNGGTEAFNPGARDDDDAALSAKDLVAKYLRHIMDEELNLSSVVDGVLEPIRRELYAKKLSQSEAEEKGLKVKADAIRGLMKQAKAIYKDRSKNFSMVQTTMGHFLFVKKDREGYVSEFEVPDDYIARCIHGEQSLPDHVISAIKELWLNGRSDTTLFALRALDKSRNESQGMTFDEFIDRYKKYGAPYAWEGHLVGGNGQNPSLDVLMNGTHQGGEFFHHAENVKKMIDVMNRSGYVGIVYDGGIRMGAHVRGRGGLLHTAYVFWDAVALNQFRTGSAKVSDPALTAGLEKGIRLSRKLYSV